MKKIKVSSSQFNYKYGDQIHFPYSIGTLVAWVKSKEDLKDKFDFDKTFVFRSKLEEYVERCDDTDILLCSCYVWNWEMTKELARQVRARNPNCLIVFGGPQVPKWHDHYEEQTFFEAHPYIDIIVHGEGEQVLENILRAYSEGTGYEEVNGIETRNFSTPPQDRIKDISELPSPYLTNIIWDLVEDEPGVKYIAAWESNRGCPFSCTFCDWGSATMSKVRKRSLDRLMQEIEWFGKNNIPYIDVCDANFGLFKGIDLELAKKFASVKEEYGYPEKIRPAWAKVSSEKIIPVAKVLLESEMLRAVTLAVQSLDEHTLKTIKRRNIKFDKWSELVSTFRSHGIENYTEIILGLPGETLESFKNNLEQMAELFPRPVIYAYNCGVFPNAPMNEPNYRETHGIETIKSPVYLMHSTHHEKKVAEYEDIVIATNSMTTEELHEAFLYSWALQAFHSFGILEYVSRFFHDAYGMKYMDFYTSLMNYCKTGDDSIFKDEYEAAVKYIKNGYSGKGWEHYDPTLGEICWPLEEATLLRCVRNSERLEKDIFKFLTWLDHEHGFATASGQLKDLSKFQSYVMTTRNTKELTKESTFEYDWVGYFNSEEPCDSIAKALNTYQHENKVVEEDNQLWCYKTAWWGRGPKKYKTDPVDIVTVDN